MIDKVRQYRWKSVPSSKNNLPTPRWGHASVVIKNEFVVYGGYAGTKLIYLDTFYKADLWVYNSELK
jgi:hypothetical protein